MQQKYQLSRTFCTLICRNSEDGIEPELAQIEKISGVDLQNIYEMETNIDDYDEELEFLLEEAESEQEREALLQGRQKRKDAIRGNLDRVLFTVNELLDRVAQIEDLDSRIVSSKFLRPVFQDYFSDFHTDRGDGYIGNNFGHDLRNFKQFLEYVKSKGAEPVYFMYG